MTIVLAHGTGEAAAFPVDITYALIGGSWALAISFLVLAFAWKTPRLSPDKHIAVLPRLTRFADSRGLRELLGAIGVILTVASLLVGFLARDEHENPLVGTFFIWLWVGLVPASLLFGPVGRYLSPVRTLHRWACAALGRPPERGLLDYPRALGRWPAAIGLFAFVWLELAVVEKGFAAVFWWCAVYLAITGAGAVVFGSRWFAQAEPFEVYSTVIATMSPLARDASSRQLVLRNPLRGLSTYATGPGAVAVIAVLLGSTAFDAWSATHDADGVAVRSAIMLGFILLVGATFCAATMATGGVTRTQRLAIPGKMAHTLIPIAVGYLIAHYAKYFVEDGQATLHAWLRALGLSEPATWTPFTDHPTALSVTAVAAIIVGHLLAVVAAHDAALRILPRRHHLTGQLALMLLMVGYTFTGLYLLFGG
ncbi:hypothetical protein GOARA_067_00280 [Gordonia araii NBRC 100433]|uniref:Uncharacterized protein n=1 Tax=Gordonia araii NBRC 100433 TaxID=1073574 RepID=G7H647_9ACTN|nr:hypothetical protein [Gordonia araii]NNG98716.1 hypothetical protein [Gordonia araii NBRC 100433]GAB11286.1 hypothetical protein GOARA_067_00280 [Gordonia araii NBRC 100433]